MLLLVDESPLIELPLPSGLELVRAVGLWAGLAQLRAFRDAGNLPSAVVVGPNVERPLEAARQLHAVAPDTHIVLLCPSGGETLRRALQFDPQVGSDWTVLDAAAKPAIAEQLAEVRLAALQRRKVRLSFDRMNERVGRRRVPTVNERLSATEGALATILGTAFEAVVSCDVEGLIVAWNRSAETMFGRSESEAVGALASTILPVPDDIASRMAGARVALPIACTFDGRELELRVAAVRGLDQEFLGMVVVARDVSALRTAERELRRLESALAARPAGRSQ